MTAVSPPLLDVLNGHLDRMPTRSIGVFLALANEHWPDVYWRHAVLRLAPRSLREAQPLDGADRAAVMRLHRLRHMPEEAAFDKAVQCWSYLAARGMAVVVREALEHFDLMHAALVGATQPARRGAAPAP